MDRAAIAAGVECKAENEECESFMINAPEAEDFVGAHDKRREDRTSLGNCSETVISTPWTAPVTHAFEDEPGLSGLYR
jgi:hypothetical protein